MEVARLLVEVGHAEENNLVSVTFERWFWDLIWENEQMRVSQGMKTVSLVRWVLGLILTIGCVLPSVANADLVITASAASWTVSPGGTGSFDIIVTNPVGQSAVNVASFNTSMISQDTTLKFTGADGNTVATAPYIFGTVQWAPLSSDTFPSSSISVSDINSVYLSADPPTNVSIGSGQTYGLAHVTFTVSASATPNDTISILFGSGTSITDAANTQIAFLGVNGQPLDSTGVTVTVGAAAVPEPSTLVLAGLVTGCGVWMARRRRTSLRTTSMVTFDR